jgi:hypothetical protein
MTKKPKYPWLHKMTPEQRSDMLDADFAAQEEQAAIEEREALKDNGFNVPIEGKY